SRTSLSSSIPTARAGPLPPLPHLARERPLPGDCAMSERDFSRAQARDDDERWQRCPDDDEFGPDDDYHEEGADWRRSRGIFVLAPIGGEAGRVIAELQRRYDPKLAASHAPHVTVVGSSGVGPIQAGTDVAELRARLEPIARATPPITV